MYRIVLSRLLGAEGLGLYQVALSLFALFLTVGTGGIPIAVSRSVTAYQAQNQTNKSFSALSSGILASLFFTLPICLLLGVFGNHFAFLTDGGSFSAFRILLIGLCFTSVYSALRGYFWGNRNFFLPALLDIAEETVMVIVGVLLLQNVSSPLVGAEKAAWAVVISYLFSFTAATLFYLCKGGKFSKPQGQLKPLLGTALPITSVRASSSLINSAVAVLFPAMLLKAGFSQSQSLQIFGVISGMVLPVLFIPATLIGSLSLVLLPELAEDLCRRNFQRLRKNILRSIRFAALVACALIPLFFGLGEDIGRLAFSNAEAGKMIKVSAPILLPMCLTMVSTSMLNSLGFEKHTFLFYFIGAAGMLLCILFLPATIGAYAYPVGLGVSFLLTGICNFVLLFKKCTIFQKGQWQVCVQALFFPFASVIPFALFGQFLSTVCKRFFGENTAFFLTSLALFTLLFLFYAFCGLLPVKKLFSSTKKRKPNRATQATAKPHF